jgi:hypothetical protein
MRVSSRHSARGKYFNHESQPAIFCENSSRGKRGKVLVLKLKGRVPSGKDPPEEFKTESGTPSEFPKAHITPIMKIRCGKLSAEFLALSPYPSKSLLVKIAAHSRKMRGTITQIDMTPFDLTPKKTMVFLSHNHKPFQNNSKNRNKRSIDYKIIFKKIKTLLKILQIKSISATRNGTMSGKIKQILAPPGNASNKATATENKHLKSIKASSGASTPPPPKMNVNDQNNVKKKEDKELIRSISLSEATGEQHLFRYNSDLIGRLNNILLPLELTFTIEKVVLNNILRILVTIEDGVEIERIITDKDIMLDKYLGSLQSLWNEEQERRVTLFNVPKEVNQKQLDSTFRERAKVNSINLWAKPGKVRNKAIITFADSAQANLYVKSKVFVFPDGKIGFLAKDTYKNRSYITLIASNLPPKTTEVDFWKSIKRTPFANAVLSLTIPDLKNPTPYAYVNVDDEIQDVINTNSSILPAPYNWCIKNNMTCKSCGSHSYTHLSKCRKAPKPPK